MGGDYPPPHMGADEEWAREEPLDPEDYTVDECVEEFVGLLLSMLTSGCTSARLFCELCFWSAGFSGNETLRKYSRKRCVGHQLARLNDTPSQSRATNATT